MQIFKPHEALDYIAPYLPDNPIIVEAGAFNGTDTIRIAKKWPSGVVHAFEPVPQLYTLLQKRTLPYTTIHCYPYALSDRNGSAPFYVSEKPNKPNKASQGGSLLKPKERLKHSPLIFPHTIEVPTITLGSWMKQYQVAHIDMLWLDMQGYELAVLQAAASLLEMIRVIYTEVSFIEGYESQPQVEIITSWLEKRGFKCIAQDYTCYTDHFFGNRLFVHTDI